MYCPANLSQLKRKSVKKKTQAAIQMSHYKTARQYKMKDISIKLLWIRVAQFESVVQLSDDGLWQCFIASATLLLRGGICEKECLFSYESTSVLTEKFTYTYNETQLHVERAKF